MKKGVECLIDYFTFTVKSAESPQQVIKDWLGMDISLFEDEDYSSLQGYSRQLRFSNILVCYGGKDRIDRKTGELCFDGTQMGICVSMSGNGCRTLERFSSRNVHKDGPFPSLFRDIVADGGVNVTRCDVACDDRHGYLDLEDIAACVDPESPGAVNSRLKKRKVCLNYDGEKQEGSGIYIGSEKSAFRMRIYDKALEQGVDGHWVRCELVFRYEEALGFVRKMAESASVGELAAQVLNDKCSFVYRDDSNITRCTVCEWWADFVSTLEAVALVVRQSIQQPVERKAEWFRHACGPMVALFVQTLGFSWLYEVFEDSVERLTPQQEALIRDYNNLQRALRLEKSPLPPSLPVMV